MFILILDLMDKVNSELPAYRRQAQSPFMVHPLSPHLSIFAFYGSHLKINFVTYEDTTPEPYS
jgi:hypothetical protein